MHLRDLTLCPIFVSNHSQFLEYENMNIWNVHIAFDCAVYNQRWQSQWTLVVCYFQNMYRIFGFIDDSNCRLCCFFLCLAVYAKMGCRYVENLSIIKYTLNVGNKIKCKTRSKNKESISCLICIIKSLNWMMSFKFMYFNLTASTNAQHIFLYCHTSMYWTHLQWYSICWPWLGHILCYPLTHKNME